MLELSSLFVYAADPTSIWEFHVCIQFRDWPCHLQSYTISEGRNHAGLAVHAAKETIRLLQKTLHIPEAEMQSVIDKCRPLAPAIQKNRKLQGQSHHLAQGLFCLSAVLCEPLTVLIDRQMA